MRAARLIAAAGLVGLGVAVGAGAATLLSSGASLPAVVAAFDTGSDDGETRALAVRWLDERGFDAATLGAMAPKERALRLTQAVYAACEAGASPGAPDDLFERCVGYCGNFAWLLRRVMDEAERSNLLRADLGLLRARFVKLEGRRSRRAQSDGLV